VDGATRGPVYSHAAVSGERKKEMIKKENNFQQVGAVTSTTGGAVAPCAA
jgi:hypothetical protein